MMKNTVTAWNSNQQEQKTVGIIGTNGKFTYICTEAK